MNGLIPIRFLGNEVIDLIHPWDVTDTKDIGYYTQVTIGLDIRYTTMRKQVIDKFVSGSVSGNI